MTIDPATTRSPGTTVVDTRLDGPGTVTTGLGTDFGEAMLVGVDSTAVAGGSRPSVATSIPVDLPPSG